jgi:TRAP-type mannitol/chloroaromatic compound transport system permease small subunit
VIRLIRALDRFSERCGVLIAWLFVPLVASVIWEVTSRYLFNRPTTWAYESIYTLNAALFMLGAAYALRVGAHVRTDFLWQRWSLRTRAAVEIVAYVLFFLPGMLLFLAAGFESTWTALAVNERSADSPWFPPLWPLKAIVPLSAALLMLQGLSELAKSLHEWRTGEALERGSGP